MSFNIMELNDWLMYEINMKTQMIIGLIIWLLVNMFYFINYC